MSYVEHTVSTKDGKTVSTCISFETNEALLYYLQMIEEAPNPVDVMVALIEQEGCSIIKPQFDAAREYLQEEI